MMLRVSEVKSFSKFIHMKRISVSESAWNNKTKLSFQLFLQTAAPWPHILRSIRRMGMVWKQSVCRPELHEPIYNCFVHRNNDPAARLRHLPRPGSISRLSLPPLQPNACHEQGNNPWQWPLSCLTHYSNMCCGPHQSSEVWRLFVSVKIPKLDFIKPDVDFGNKEHVVDRRQWFGYCGDTFQISNPGRLSKVKRTKRNTF